jgi:hypothetical protein
MFESLMFDLTGVFYTIRQVHTIMSRPVFPPRCICFRVRVEWKRADEVPSAFPLFNPYMEE